MLNFIFSFSTFISCVIILAPKVSFAQLSIVPFVSNVFKVTDITHCNDNRLFIVEQAGRIRISDLQGNLYPILFLNIAAKVNNSGGEQGLLGLAFSPNYKYDGRFYINYINNSGNTVIARYTTSLSNPDEADSLSEEILFTVNQPYSNHNGGAMHFGPDGYLYIGLGDGGAGGDPLNNAQNLQVKLGKLLRIDVSDSSGYKIPPSNPFLGIANADSMIWSYGLRNPWRFSFDRLTGDQWIGDVGQGLWEEINFQPAMSQGGENYGWRCYEGLVGFNLNGCSPAGNYDFPVYVFGHFPACSVTGGYVYRGAQNASWFGKYFFTDYCSGEIQSLTPADTGGYILEDYGAFGNYAFSTFGEDQYGELYLGKATSGVFKMIDDDCQPVAYLSALDTIQSINTSVLLQTPLAPGFTYQWYFNDELIPGFYGNSFQAKISGYYKVKVTNDSACSNISKTVLVLLKTNNAIEAFPNPAGDYTQITWSSNFPGSKILEVIDARGRLCEKVTLDIKSIGYKLNTSKFSQGLYIVRIIYNNSSYPVKLMIK